jgi:hypothetical protein
MRSLQPEHTGAFFIIDATGDSLLVAVNRHITTETADGWKVSRDSAQVPGSSQ